MQPARFPSKLARCGVLLAASALGAGPADRTSSSVSYPIVDTAQMKCYGSAAEIACPEAGQPFASQDAQTAGNAPRYAISRDGLTVVDAVTGLTWQRGPDTNDDGALDASDKLTWSQARVRPAALNAARFGGFADWRLPNIKELYSLIVFSGQDPSGMTDASGLTPFIDSAFFKFAYGQTSAGERIIDSQYASSTLSVDSSWAGTEKLFGVNFADGRIKGYDLALPGGSTKTFFVQCVRGNPAYGLNDLLDNGDQTVIDRATGLTWSKADSGKGLNWEEALAWVEARNAERYLGRDDWRLPNAKELQSLVDNTRSPDATGTAAISPLLACTPIVNEAGQTDFPFYWTSTTHAGANGSGAAAVYIAFGRALGYLGGAWQNIHGAGAQRSDPKIGDPADFPFGRGPQGDAIRIYNYVRLVRGVSPAAASVSKKGPIRR